MQLLTLLTIFQQSEYSFPRLQKWAQAHPNPPTLTPHWTTKLRLLYGLSFLFFFLPPLKRLAIGLSLLSPFEWVIRQVAYALAGGWLMICKILGLQVIAIAGSYGKTSTKHIAAHVLSAGTPTLMTPKSINTLLGISLVILKQLKPHHKLFIVELGEYNPGDLKAVTNFVKPKWGVMTPIGKQHLELLGSVERIAEDIGELLHFFKGKTDRVLVAEHNQAFFSHQQLHYYGTQSQSDYRVINVKTSRAGTEFTVVKNSQEIGNFFMPLFGEAQAMNTLPSFWLAEQLHIPIEALKKQLASLPYIERRHQPTFAENNVLVLDNSYNTNPDSIKESLKLLNQLDATHRIIVFPGFVELGPASRRLHREFGELLATSVDYVGLYGAVFADEIKTGFLEKGGRPQHIIEAKTQDEVVAQLQPFIIPNSVILFEGGMQELYQ